MVIPFENTMLASLAGVFTAPLGVLLLPAMLLYVVTSLSLFEKADLWLIKFFLLVLLISILNLSVLIADYDIGFLIDRGLRFALLAIPTMAVYLFCIRLNLATLEKGVKIIFAVVAAIYVVNLLVPSVVNSSSPLQFSEALSPHRMRGFTFEASMFGFQFVIASLMFACVMKFPLKIVVPLILILCIPITSKGAQIFFMLAVFVAIVQCFIRLQPIAKVLVSICLSTLLIWVSSGYVASMFASDIEKYSSVATRSTIFLTPIVALFSFPQGSGFFGFLPSIYSYGPIAMDFLDAMFPNALNFTEVMPYFVVGNVKGVGTKSFFMDWLLYGGLVFLFFYSKAVGAIFSELSQKKSFYPICMFCFVVFSTFFYVPADGRYIAPFAIAYIVRLMRESRKEQQAL
ncbi:hypothetical protein [Agaribacterium sp. ZY112]|uniref:hypothetical protein n=1 Tax=Agaribacterium sp. ZY112 TaxID=3233574 RepID=UPI0035257F7F